MSLSTALLKPGESDRLVAGHPWVYSNSIVRLTGPANDGDAVQVKDHRGRFVGVGLYNSRSKIAIRLLDRERSDFDGAFFKERIGAALALRRRQMPNATSYRVVNAESDFLSGLIVDKYEDVLVIQTSSLGMDKRKHHITAAQRPGLHQHGCDRAAPLPHGRKAARLRCRRLLRPRPPWPRPHPLRQRPRPLRQ
jgi:23S rRNA (cytosine1962-C5)-methyltransferase